MPPLLSPRIRLTTSFGVLVLLTSCDDQGGTSFDSLEGIEESGKGPSEGGFWSESMLHAEIEKSNPGYQGGGTFKISGGRVVAVSLTDVEVSDLSFLERLPSLEALEITGTSVVDLGPLAGSSIQELWAERTQVENLTPLRGVPLKKLHLSMTPVEQLTGLEGAPLEELNLAGTLVKDLSPLSDSPIQTLWLNGCPVSDIAPLAGMPLIDLSLSSTAVTDISPLAETRVLRLDMEDARVADVTPLADTRITRLVFTPQHVTAGLDQLRDHETLREIGTTTGEMGNDIEPVAVFWAQQDGRLSRPEPYDTSGFQEPDEPEQETSPAASADEEPPREEPDLPAIGAEDQPASGTGEL